MTQASDNNAHKVIGAILLSIATLIIIALVMVYSQADSVNTAANIANQNPAVDTIYVSSSANGETNDFGSGVDLVAGGTKTIHINGTVSDANGAGDINDVDVVVYRSVLGATCSLDYNNCYIVNNCTLSANNDTSKKYNCAVNLEFYTDASDDGGRFPALDYRSRVIVNDKNSGSGFLTSLGPAVFEVNTLLSVSLPASIDYGAMSNNTSTTAGNNQDLVIEQQGNDEADLQISGTDMVCSGLGTIDKGNQKWALIDVGWTATDNMALTGSPFDTDFNLVYRENDGVAKTKIMHMNMYVPFGVNGTCIGTNTVTTIAH